MHPFSGRHLLRAAGAGALVLPLTGRAPAAASVPGLVSRWVGAGSFTQVFAATAEGRVRTRVQARPGGGRQPWTSFGDRAVDPWA
ncbi:hypothetical protein ACFY9Y_27480 [Streptomyces fimicarius]|uniref:hypothetical protein n=1 Tax=Streptomyces griseus TaxID=1911 RepID=UPI0036E57356